MATPPPSAVQPCAQCWIELELLDEQDVGASREPYWVKLPDGQIREGRLDDRGFVRLEGIPCGVCVVRFPKTTGPAVRLQASYPAGERFIEIVLEAVDGSPAPDERYRLTLPDGAIREGQLDAGGRARVDGLRAETCQVDFPNLHGKDYAKVK